MIGTYVRSRSPTWIPAPDPPREGAAQPMFAKSRKETIVEQAHDLARDLSEAIAPHVERARDELAPRLAGARDQLADQLTEAREQAAPYVKDARERLADAREQAAPLLAD